MQAKASANITALTEHVEQLKRTDEELGAMPVPGVDELVASVWPLYEQLVRLVAEDNAITDTLFHLGRALDKGVMALDMYLKVGRVCGGVRVA